MNDTSVHTILAAISEAKMALDREPEYKARITELENSANSAFEHNQQLELKAIGYRSQIETLEARVRSLEVERDDASFRNLELEDKVAGFTVLVNTYAGNIESLAYDLRLEQGKLNPKPEPEVKPETPPSINPTEPMLAPTPEQVGIEVALSYPPDPVSNASPELPYKGKKWSEILPHVSSMTDWEAGGGTHSDFWI